MEQQPRQEQKGMKLWVKIVLIVAIVLFLMCGGGALILYKMGSNFMKGFTDKDTMLKITQSICEIEIPEDYTLKGAFEMAGFKFSMIAHEKSGQEIMLLRMPPSAGSEKDLRKSFDDEKFADQLLSQTGQGSNSLQVKNVKEKKKITINDREFPYALCDMEKDGEKKEGIIGLFNDSITKKPFLIFAYNNPGSYDNEITITLLESIK